MRAERRRCEVAEMCTRNRKAAFTLVELLVVIGIIIILAGITLPAITGQTRMARRINCNSNLGQIGKGLFTYMTNWSRDFVSNRPEALTPQRKDAKGANILTFETSGYDDLSPLWGVPAARLERRGTTFESVPIWSDQYVGNIRTFNCPSTRDVCGTIAEPVAERWSDTYRAGWWFWKEIRYKRTGASLIYTWNTSTARYDLTAGTPSPPAKLSYEYCGEFSPGMHFPGINPSRAWLAHDEDAANENTRTILRDKVYDSLALTKDSNHGKTGGNMLFLDGRVEWVSSLNWIQRVVAGIEEWQKETGWKLGDAYLEVP